MIIEQEILIRFSYPEIIEMIAKQSGFTIKELKSIVPQCLGPQVWILDIRGIKVDAPQTK